MYGKYLQTVLLRKRDKMAVDPKDTKIFEGLL